MRTLSGHLRTLLSDVIEHFPASLAVQVAKAKRKIGEFVDPCVAKAKHIIGEFVDLCVAKAKQIICEFVDHGSCAERTTATPRPNMDLDASTWIWI